MKTLVLGLGNPILTDDGVGIHVVRAIAAQCPLADHVAFAEACVGGMRLLDLLAGYDRVFLVDAIQTRDGQPGQIYTLGPGDLHGSLHTGSTHDLTLASALDLGRCLEMGLPADEDLVVVAVEAGDVLTIGETCTAPVVRAIPRAADIILAHLVA